MYLRRKGQLFYRLPHKLGLSGLFSPLDACEVFGAVCSTSGAVSFPVCPIRTHVMLIWSFTGDVDFDHLGKVVSARFFHCKITVFHFLMNRYLMGRSYFESALLSITHQTFTH